jgi:penicillin-binding protein A
MRYGLSRGSLTKAVGACGTNGSTRLATHSAVGSSGFELGPAARPMPHAGGMRAWVVGLAGVGLLAAITQFSRGAKGAAGAEGESPAAALTAAPTGSGTQASPPTAPKEPSIATVTRLDLGLTGLDLIHIGLGDDGATAPLDHGRTARLTVDPILQSTAWQIMAARHIPEAAIVLLDPETGEVLAYASHIESGPVRDLPGEARAPAASVFKIITASALVDDAGLNPDTRQCYSGGEERILASDLVDNPARDRWCVTLGGAMGRSVNAVFARLAKKHLEPSMLEREAAHFGFGQALAFDTSIEPSILHIPEGELAFARTAAGFWNTTLSPMHAAWISAALERGGDPVRAHIVRSIRARTGEVTDLPAPNESHTPVVSRATADAVVKMMEHTVSEGTSFRAFHDARRRPFLPGITVAGKTGTLTDERAQRFYTWFTGFAPSEPVPGVRPVAVAVLVVNGPSWTVKANVLARESLQAFFAEQKVPGVSRPKGTSLPSESD